jgi:hypothetical protein
MDVSITSGSGRWRWQARPGEHSIVIGVESFGEMTVGGDGHPLSEPENIRLFGTEVVPRVREQLQ